MFARRLFVPLASAPFAWFSSGQKTWELRKYGRQYTEQNLQRGRRVELRRGYSDPDQAVWGTLGDVARAEGLRAFFRLVPFSLVIPTAETEEQAVEQAQRILNLPDQEPCDVIGFQVEVDR